MSTREELNHYSNILDLISYYNENKDKDWKEWLSFDTVFDKPSKQGIVGLLEMKNNTSVKLVFKISQYINYLIQHESTVMNGLNSLSTYCPHFCCSVGTILCDVEPKCKKQDNPFNIISKHPIKKEALLCEFIDKSCKFYNYIRSDRISEDILYSTVKQVLLALAIAQRKKQFSHYDLHSFNIMMKKCDKDAVFLYVLDDENQFAIPTYGHYPVIIDFGFSYINDMEDGPLWPSLAHTDIGFMSDRFDWVADPKLFLVTVSSEIKNKRNSKRSRIFRRVVKNIFHPLNIDWSSGWDEGQDKGASDYVTEMISDYNPGSILFDEYEHYCIDLLQSMIILPLEEQDYSKIHKSYEVFVKEWMKVESQISSPYYNLYILKGVIDSARLVRVAYTYQSTRLDAIRTFRHSFNDKVKEVANFVRLDGIQYEKILCSLIVFSRCMEGVLYDVMTARMAEKEREYKKLPLQSIEQVYAGIEVNLPDRYEYNNNTTISIFDSYKETAITTYQIPEEHIKNINDMHPITRGTFLYDLYKTQVD